VKGPKTRSERSVLVELPSGERRRMPTAWTSLAPEDPYGLLSERPLLRLDALMELAEWVERQESRRGESGRVPLGADDGKVD